MMRSIPLERVGAVFAPTVFTRSDLRLAGLRGRDLTAMVRAGQLLRLRRDRYARPDVDGAIADATRVGGRVTCLSLLQLLGVFVLDSSALHVQVLPSDSRLRRHLAARLKLHWSADGEHPELHVTELSTAIRHAIRCQAPRATIATLDSLVHHGFMTMDQLRVVFSELPPRFRPLLNLVDASAASGPETFVRLMLRALGVTYETQVFIPGVGYVDFVVDGWLIIECDSREFHEGWAKQQQDRARDIAAARLGYVTVRPLASDILHESGATKRALQEIIVALGPRFAGRRRSQLRRNVH